VKPSSSLKPNAPNTSSFDRNPPPKRHKATACRSFDPHDAIISNSFEEFTGGHVGPASWGKGILPVKTSNKVNGNPASRRDFLITASLAAAAAASGIGLATVNGATSAIDAPPECSPVPPGTVVGSEAGAKPLPGESPLSAIGEHVCGLHFYSGDMNRQVIAQHYCSHVSRDIRQCVIYDSDKRHARLVGIEYIISSKLFEELPSEEKKLWHNHVYEVKSGQLIAPQVPESAEMEAMKGLVGTYGKTWYTWQVDRGDKVPLGIPQLMMAFTADGQVHPQLLAERDAEYGISSERKRKSRAEIVSPAIQAGADAWQQGEAIQLQTKTITMKEAP
jgi:hypothetical protein